MDVLLIGFFLSPTELGYYTVAVTLSRFFWLIPSSIQTITYPITASYWIEEKYRLLNNVLDKSIKYSTIMLLPIGLFIGLLSKDLIILVFKETFSPAVITLQILLLGTIIRGSVSTPVGATFSGIGRPDMGFKITLLYALINIGLDIILIPRIGINGAAFGASTSFIIIAVISLYLMNRMINFKFDFIWYGKIVMVTLFSVMIFVLLLPYGYSYVLAIIIIFIFIFILYKYFLEKSDKKYFKSLIESTINRIVNRYF